MSDWTTTVTPPAAKPLSESARSAIAHYGDVDKVFAAWQNAATALALAKDLEQRLRNVVFELKFPNATEGTNRVELGGGYSLKCQYPYTYKLDDKESKTERALDAIAEISQQAGFIADRLVKWQPEISIKEYRLLNPDTPEAQTDEQKKILAIISPILTIKPGMPQLELEKPKGK
jgi:hypothetical protein